MLHLLPGSAQPASEVWQTVDVYWEIPADALRGWLLEDDRSMEPDDTVTTDDIAQASTNTCDYTVPCHVMESINQ